MGAPIDVDMGDVPREACERLERDDEKRCSDGLAHGEPAEQGERRDDQKPASSAWPPSGPSRSRPSINNVRTRACVLP